MNIADKLVSETRDEYPIDLGDGRTVVTHGRVLDQLSGQSAVWSKALRDLMAQIQLEIRVHPRPVEKGDSFLNLGDGRIVSIELPPHASGSRYVCRRLLELLQGEIYANPPVPT